MMRMVIITGTASDHGASDDSSADDFVHCVSSRDVQKEVGETQGFILVNTAKVEDKITGQWC